MSNEVINPYQRFYDALGDPLENGTLTFNINETSTLDTIYSDEALTIAQSNPYPLDAAGRMTGDVRYLGKKRMVVKDQTGATVRTLDHVVTASNSREDLASYAIGYSTIALMIADTQWVVGDIGKAVHVKEYTAGKGVIDAFYDIVASGTGTNDGFEYHDSTGSATIQFRLRINPSKIDVRLAGCHSDGTTDVTTQLQVVFDYAEATGDNNIVYFPAGRYYITSGIEIYEGCKIQGDNLDHGGVAGATSFPDQMSDSKGTVLIFDPSTQQTLFAPADPKGGSAAWSGIGIKGLNIWGNSSMDDYHRTLFGDTDPVVTTSLYAIDFDEVHFSSVKDVAITGFVSGIRCGSRNQENFFARVHVERTRESSIVYTEFDNGVIPTSDVWDKCVFRIGTAVVIQDHDSVYSPPSGSSLQIRFHNCYFENMANYLAVIPCGAKNWEFVTCYAEGMGLDTGVSDRGAFKVCQDGTVPASDRSRNLTIVGGQYAGPATPGGTFLSTDNSDIIDLISVEAKRFSSGIVATVNTRDASIFLANMTFLQVATLFTDTTDKIVGSYRTVDLGGGSDVFQVKSSFVVSDGQLQFLGSSIRLGDGTTSDSRPGGDATMSTGIPSARWSDSFNNKVSITDGISAPSQTAGYATFFVDSADGDLKIIFGDGTVKTIVTDT